MTNIDMNTNNGAIIALFNEINRLQNEVDELKQTIKGNKITREIPETSESLEVTIRNILFSCHIPANIKGYRCLRTAIKMVYQDENLLNSMTKILYPTIAKEHNTTYSRVERAIRHAIEIAWSKNDYPDFMKHVIERPTNAEFIALVVEHLKLDKLVESA